MTKYKNIDDAIENLKKSVDKLEKNDDAELETRMEDYEKGMEAYKYCLAEIDKIKEKIKIIDNN